MKIFLILWTVVALLSCKSKATLITALDNPKEQLYEIISSTDMDYHWFSAKARVRLKTSEFSGSGRMNIRMIRDSLIWFNIKKVSIEGARGIIDPKSFAILYRQEKKYEHGELEELLNHYGLPLSFEELQFYIAGNIPIAPKNALAYKKSNHHHFLYGSNEKYKLTYSFDSDLNLVAFSLTDEQNRKLSIELDKKDELQGIYLGRKLFFPYNKQSIGVLEIDLSNIEINVPKKIPFSIPDHYTEY